MYVKGYTPITTPPTLRNRDTPRVPNHSINNLKISKMVTVVNYALRKTSEGREFYVLILQGGLSLCSPGKQETGMQQFAKYPFQAPSMKQLPSQ